jgi:hypothetical protein
MENEMTNPKDVAKPDAVVSGMAGTGEEHKNETGIIGKIVEENPTGIPVSRSRGRYIRCE